MTDIEFKQKLENYQTRINECLSTVLGKPLEKSENAIEAAYYSLECGGKRLRPLLVLEFAHICGVPEEKVWDYLPIACTAELIHTYSLIHDDLPCMDNDDFRRGKPSCHKKFGEDIALLAGDALNTKAFEIISNEALNGVVNFETACRLINILSSAAGFKGMVGGQVIDLESEGSQINIETLTLLQSGKTGAMITASCLMGCAIAGEYNSRIYADAAHYSALLGRTFQIVDDILDVTGDFESLGKPIGSDEQQGKSTFVSLLGLEGAKEQAEKLTNQSFAMLDNFKDNEFIKMLTQKLLNRKY